MLTFYLKVSFNGRHGEMIKTPTMQDLREKIYIKAKADPTHKFWGIYIHVHKIGILAEAYAMSKRNNGAAGGDGKTFEKIEAEGLEKFLMTIQKELATGTYKPEPNRKCEIPKANGKTRTLSIPTIKDRVVQGALKIVLEPIFEADFQEGSWGYRPNRDPHKAIESVKQAILLGKTYIIDVDIKAYFDRVRHDLLFKKAAQRVKDDKIMHLLKIICKASGKRGIPQGGPLSPLLANIVLNEVDRMLEKAKETTKWQEKYTKVGYARFADDLVILINGHRNEEWLRKGVHKRLREEIAKLDLEINSEKTKCVDLTKGESFTFLGFEMRLVKSLSGKIRPQTIPKKEGRSKLVAKVKDICRRYRSQPIEEAIKTLNPIIRGWVNYYRVGNSARCFKNIRRWIERKVRRLLARARGQKGFGWKRWSSDMIYVRLKLYNDYRVRYYQGSKVQPA